MLLREWAEALNVLSAKDQHIYAASMRVNPIFQSIARFHNWSWLKREFTVKTAPAFTSAHDTWVRSYGSQGEDHVYCIGISPLSATLAVVGDIGIEWTGAEILISDGSKTQLARIKKIAGPLKQDPWGYTKFPWGDSYSKFIYIDRDLSGVFDVAAPLTIKVFRRDYLPVTGEDHDRHSILASRLYGELYSRADSADTVVKIDQSQRELYGSRYTDTSVNFSAPNTYTMERFNKLPTPKYPPKVIDGAWELAAGVPDFDDPDYPDVEAGDYYLACSYYCKHTGEMSDLGPIIKYTVAPGATAINRIGVAYDVPRVVSDVNPFSNQAGGFPEESYQLLLWISDANPTGLNNKTISSTAANDNGISSRYIPFYLAGKHTMAPASQPYNTPDNFYHGVFYTTDFHAWTAGILHAVDASTGLGFQGIAEYGYIYFNYKITENRRHYPTWHSELIRFTEAPIEDQTYCINGAMRMPWFCGPYDAPPIPDDMLDLVSTAMSVSIKSSAGAESAADHARLQYMLGTLKSSDLRKSQSGSMDYRYRGGMPYIDRYRID